MVRKHQGQKLNTLQINEWLHKKQLLRNESPNINSLANIAGEKGYIKKFRAS